MPRREQTGPLAPLSRPAPTPPPSGQWVTVPLPTPLVNPTPSPSNTNRSGRPHLGPSLLLLRRPKPITPPRSPPGAHLTRAAGGRRSPTRPLPPTAGSVCFRPAGPLISAGLGPANSGLLRPTQKRRPVELFAGPRGTSAVPGGEAARRAEPAGGPGSQGHHGEPVWPAAAAWRG